MVEVEVTGVTMGTVLQTTVDEVDWLTRAVSDVTTVVEVLVLVTADGLINLALAAMFQNVYLPIWVVVIVVTTEVVAGLNVV